VNADEPPNTAGLDFEPDTFLVTGPLWVVLHPSCVDRDGHTIVLGDTAAFIAVPTSQGWDYHPLFTDRDLAERFRDQVSTLLPFAPTLGSLRTGLAVLQFLEGVARSGIDRVAFDPRTSKGQFNRLLPLTQVLQELREQSMPRD
jgi:hypothetical protein